MEQPEGANGGTLRYVLPFGLFLAMLWAVPKLPISASIALPLWFVIFIPVCVICWPRSLSTIPKHALWSTALGVAVFALWIAPEVLIHNYRDLPLFSNSVLGHVHSTLPAAALRSPWVLFWRTARAALIVPVVEELFWRAWLMRWLINPEFQRVRIGQYGPAAFWITALLFASEHGPYWEVGLVTGAIYNWWTVRTKSIADCVVMHGVTNLALSLYVIATGNWQYWQ